jgi:hypothetical protein
MYEHPSPKTLGGIPAWLPAVRPSGLCVCACVSAQESMRA